MTKKTGNAKRHQPSFLSQKQEQIQARDLAAVPHKPLKLKAHDPVDLEVISALLQDAIVPGTNFHYDAPEKTFTLLVNRFCWEDSSERLNHKKVYERILCCLQFHHVDNVQHQNLDPKNPDEHYNLLSFEGITSDTVILTFSGNSKIKLIVREISCLVTDLEDMWYTTNHPDHNPTSDAA